MVHEVPKRTVAVRVHLSSGECRCGHVFLDYIDVIHRGEQTLLDKLNDDYCWFALRGEEGSAIEIINRVHVVLVEPGAGLAPELVRKEDSPVFRREKVTVHMDNDRTVSGQIAMDLPDEFSRVSDFLNFPQNFFAVETAEGPILVSKEHVVRLLPHEKPPAMPDSAGAEVEERA